MVVFEGRNGKGEMLLYYYLKINLKFYLREFNSITVHAGHLGSKFLKTALSQKRMFNPVVLSALYSSISP